MPEIPGGYSIFKFIIKMFQKSLISRFRLLTEFPRSLVHF